jgi:hypothetical protein
VIRKNIKQKNAAITYNKKRQQNKKRTSLPCQDQLKAKISLVFINQDNLTAPLFTDAPAAVIILIKKDKRLT